jgi:hypothetical protein
MFKLANDHRQRYKEGTEIEVTVSDSCIFTLKHFYRSVTFHSMLQYENTRAIKGFKKVIKIYLVFFLGGGLP